MVKEDDQRGPVGAWMRRERIAHGWTVEQTVNKMAEAGYPVLPAYYRTVEAGPKPPGPAFVGVLAHLFGTWPVLEDETRHNDIAQALESLSDTLREQTEVLREILRLLSSSS